MIRPPRPRLWLVLAAAGILTACRDGAWNHPYPEADARANVLYSAFEERPKHLDPARSYSENENVFLAQIYEPPLQYHYLLRPYTLVPLTAEEVPVPRYLDAQGGELPPDAPVEQIAVSEYLVRIRPGVRYQPHPAFAQDDAGAYLYHRLGPADLAGVHILGDFPISGTRELTAEDYVYQIKRLAVPWVNSPIAGVMQEHIEDFTALGQRIAAASPKPPPGSERPYLDLRQIPFAGAVALDRYQMRLRIRGKYPQMLYWLAMPFFAPIPWEADRFYSQPGMKDKNLTLDWYPVGTGPFWLSENNPNLRMVLTRNPHFHGETYPSKGMPGDEAAGLLADAGRPLPLVERAIYSKESESIPYWNKFLQGYYDASGISSDAFDQAVKIDERGEPSLTPEMARQGMRMVTAVEPSIFYMGVNMRDPVIGGDAEGARLLRRAIAIAVDYEEFISIFRNGRGLPAQGPLPPGIFGHREGQAGINPYTYTWRDGRAVRRGIDEARALLAQAGYPGGRDPATGKALSLNYEAVATGPDDTPMLNWLRKQFDKLGIQLVIRATDYNRFQDKIRNGTGQLFMWGWNADYPDPENFFFLLYGPNGKVEHGGENAANYANPEFDALFDAMKNMDNGPERQALIDRMVAITQRDAPWIFGFYPKRFSLHHAWVGALKPNQMANNTLKYRRVDPDLRAVKREQWNRPVLWPLWILGAVLAAAALPAVHIVRKRERSRAL